MALQLTIIKFPPGVSLAEDRKTFDSQGGFIGRGVDNDWVLSDPERFLSSKHCQITREGERYFLTDLSTNGTFFNGSSEPLGRGSRTPLKDGDSFDVGDYRFKVGLERDTDPFAASPFGSSSSFDQPDPFGADDFGFGKSSPVAPEAMFMSSDYQGAVQDIAPDAMKITDPLIALDNANRSLSDKDPFADPFIRSGSREDSANMMSESVAWPESRQEGSLLPEDWADDISLIGGRKSPPPAYSLPDDDSLIHDRAPVKGKDPLGEHDSLLDDPFLKPQTGSDPRRTSGTGIGGKPAGDKEPGEIGIKSVEPGRSGLRQREAQAKEVPRPRAQTAAKETPVQPQPRGQNRAHTGTKTPATVESAPVRPRVKANSTGTLDRTLVDAMGLADVDLSDEQMREIHETVGAMMRETIDGLMQVLRSRTSIKNEFRINITTIQPVENNPIKFSASVDEVLEIMFLRKSRAYKPPLDAIEESFHSIADHQMAVIAGIRSAFRSALSKFDPERLEEEFKQSGKGGLLPGVMKGRLWNAYQDHYQKVINDMERSFQELFGDEFVQAYEDQMRKLSHARKREL